MSLLLQTWFAVFNSKKSSLIQNRHPYSGDLNSETSGDSENVLPHCGSSFAPWPPRCALIWLFGWTVPVFVLLFLWLVLSLQLVQSKPAACMLTRSMMQYWSLPCDGIYGAYVYYNRQKLLQHVWCVLKPIVSPFFVSKSVTLCSSPQSTNAWCRHQLVMHANRTVVMQLMYPRATLAPENAPGHGTIPPPLESPFLQRLDPVTVQPSHNGTDVGRWDSAEQSPSKGAAGNNGSQKLAAEDTKCVMLCFQFHLLHSWYAMLSCAVSCCAMQYHALLCCDTLCRIMLCCAVSCYTTLCYAMPR